jgi:chloride channel 3/4/5
MANPDTACPGIVAEEADHPVSFQRTGLRHSSLSLSSITSNIDHPEDPFDFSMYIDKVYPLTKCPSKAFLITTTQAPLTVSINSPLELVQQLFVKLGARYVVVTDADGYCEFWLTLLCSTDGSGLILNLRR